MRGIRWLLAGWLLLGGAVLAIGAFLLEDPMPLGLSGTDFLLWRLLPVFAAWGLLYTVPVALAIADAIGLLQRRDLPALCAAAATVKLAGLPLLVQTCLLIFTVVMVSAAFVVISSLCAVCVVIAPFLMLLGALSVSVLLIMMYLIFLPTAVYAIAALIQVRRDRAAGPIFLIVMSLLQLVPVADLVGTALTLARARSVIAPHRDLAAPSAPRNRDLRRRHMDLEINATSLAATRCSPAEADQLRALHERAAKARVAGQTAVADEWAARFHERIWRIAGHLDLRRELHRLTVRCRCRRIPPVMLVEGDSATHVTQHEAILQVIIDHRPEDAVRAMHDHLGPLPTVDDGDPRGR